MKPREDDDPQEFQRIILMLRNLSMFFELGKSANYVNGDDINHEREDLICDFVSLQRVIPTLPVEERQVIALVGRRGLTQKEAAERLGISESTVRKRLQTAAARIQQQWNGRGKRR